MKHPIKEIQERKKSEALIQAEIVEYFRNTLKIERGLLFSVPNDGQFSNKFLATGLVPGFPDLCFLWNGKATFFETKVPKKDAEPHQREIHETLRKNGFNVYVIHSLEEILNIVEQIIHP